VRASKKEPFDIFSLTAGVAGFVNLRDKSFSLTPELAHTGIDNTQGIPEKFAAHARIGALME
jgi:hypothetical protein